MRDDGVEFELHRQGMLVAAREPDLAREELSKLQPMREYGYELPDDVLDPADLHEAEPALADAIDGGFIVGQHWHVRPDSFTAGLAGALRRMDVEIVEGAEVNDFARRQRPRAGRADRGGRLPADAFMLAAGAWTTPLAKMIGVRFPMQAGKGYSFFVKPSVMPKPLDSARRRARRLHPARRPMRIGGTMEFSGLNTRLDEGRIDEHRHRGAHVLCALADARDRAALGGHAPDHAGRSARCSTGPRFDNVYVATGYAMQGVTLAPPAGRAMAEFMTTGRKPELLAPFGIDRLQGRRRRRNHSG